jgi:hypothetical protein
MYKIRIFNHPTFGEIRTAGTAENPLFCLKDVCRILEIGNPSDLKRRLDEKGVQLIDYHALDSNEGTVQGNTMTNFIDEPLRAADWAEKEISDAACWLALHRRVQGDLATRLRFMMPRHSGKRKVMHHTRMMELTVGMGRYQIEMVLKRKPDCEAMSDEIDDAMECMVAWMRENAYMRQMQ